MSNVSAPMNFLFKDASGRPWYHAPEGLFTRPGVYFWDGEKNVHVDELGAAAQEAQSLPELPTFSKCSHCGLMCTDDDVTAPPQLTIAHDLLREMIDLCAVGDIDENTDHTGWSELVRDAKLLVGDEPDEAEPLSREYLLGHQHGLDWAANLAEASHPLSGDWLYDDPHELAKAIRKGPEMPESPVPSSDDKGTGYFCIKCGQGGLPDPNHARGDGEPCAYLATPPADDGAPEVPT